MLENRLICRQETDLKAPYQSWTCYISPWDRRAEEVLTVDYGKGPYGLKFSHRWKCVTRGESRKMAAAKLGRSMREFGICKYLKLS